MNTTTQVRAAKNNSRKMPRNVCGRTEKQQAAHERRQERAYRKALGLV